MITTRLPRIATILLSLWLACISSAQNLPTFEQRRDWLLGLDVPSGSIAGSGKYGMPFAVQRLWQTGGMDAAARTFTVYVAETLLYLDAEKTTRDWYSEIQFEPVGVVRAIYQWSEQFTPEEHAKVANAYRAKRPWTGGGTENHEMMTWSNGYLLAQKYGGDWYPGVAGGTVSAATLMAQLKDKFKLRAEQFYRQDMAEYVSPIYLVAHLMPLVNLYDFCQDQELRELAEALLARHLTALSLCVHQGTIVEPYSRHGGSLNAGFQNVGPAVLGTGNISLYTNWLYWGQINPTKERIQERYMGGPFHTYLAVSSFRPPSRLAQLAQGQVGLPFEAKLSAADWHDTGIVLYRYLWRTADYAIGSGVRNFSPDGFYLAHPRVGVHWSSLDSMHTMMIGHPYWHSNETDWVQWLQGTDSPFMQTAQFQNVAIILFNHPTADPWPTRGRSDWYSLRSSRVNSLRTEVYAVYPATIDQFQVHTYADGTRWYFLREGNTYFGLRVLTATWTDATNYTGTSPQNLRAIFGRTKENGQRKQSAFVVEVGTAAEDGSFTNFQARLLSNQLTVAWGLGNVPAQTVTYDNNRGIKLSATYNTNLGEDEKKRIFMAPSVTLNGAPYQNDFVSWPLLHGPYVDLTEKILSIDRGSSILQYDLSDLPEPP